MDPSAKTLLRRKVRERILCMSPEHRREADQAITRHLLHLAAELGTGTILGYLALPDEVRIDGVLAGGVQLGLEVLLPRSGDGLLHFRRWKPATPLERDDEGVWTPCGVDVDETASTQVLVVVPARALDGRGGRLGRGGGYYDRLLAQPWTGRRTVVGVAYDCQVVDAVPREPHDRPVEVIVTERGSRRVGEA